MRLRVLGWSALVLMPLLVCAGHLHARRAATPESMKDVTRCLSIVRVAASRRRKGQEDNAQRHGAAGVRTATAAKSVAPDDLARIA